MTIQTHIKNTATWLLIANGARLSPSRLLALAKDKRVMVLDGAYEDAKKIGLTIEILLGDFDSIAADVLKKIDPTETQVIHAPHQSKTDLEKGLQYLDTLKAEQIFLYAATGLRLQHTLYNIRMLKKYHHPSRTLTLLTDTECVRYFRDTTFKLKGKIGDVIALLGFPHAKITTVGLKYEVTHYALDFEQTVSISNELAQEEAMVTVVGDALCIQEHVFS